MKNHLPLITFQPGTWFWDSLRLVLLKPKVASTKPYIVPVIALVRFPQYADVAFLIRGGT